MRNKLRKVKTTRDSNFQRKDVAQTAGVIVLSESSCSKDEKDKNGSKSATGLSETQIQPVQETREVLCAKGATVAPIFLRAIQQRKRSSDRELDQPLDSMQKSMLPLQGDNVQPVKSPRAISHVTVKDRCGGQLSLSVPHSCLEEIQTSNPAFPVRAVLSTLRKKAGEGLQEHALTEKRKRVDELLQRLPKRLRSAESAAGVGHSSHQDVLGSSVHPAEKQPRSSKLSRTRSLKQHRASQPSLDESNLMKSCDPFKRDFCFEDTQWTDKYSPQHSSEVIGNPASVNKLYSWLRKWKLRAARDKGRQMEEKKRQENSNESWDCGDFQGEAGSDDGREDPLGNTLLITGPSGVGKTASVYACAQELGFKVFEVNCSSQRCGRHVLSQLKEVTQSHIVETSGKDQLKPAYFNGLNTNTCTSKSEILPGKRVLPKTVTSTSKRRTSQNLRGSHRSAKAKPATVTLTRYFRMKAKADRLQSGFLPSSERPENKKLVNSSSDSDAAYNKTATSLILFEEVDVIFEDDVGFLAAIKAFMSTTKRPVILTTNDPLFKDRFDSSLDEIIFKTPSAANMCSYLQLVCLAEGVQLDLDDARSLLRLTCGDVRRCLLQLQIWVQSGGSLKKPICEQYSDAAEGGEHLDSFPLYKSGCSAYMLGLCGGTPHHLLNLLKSWSEMHTNELLMLLAESWRRGVPLLYLNLELLLSAAAQHTSVRCLEKVAYSRLQRESSDVVLHIQQHNRSICQRASLTNSKSLSHMSRLSRRKYNNTSSDRSALEKTFSFNGTPSRALNSGSKARQTAAKEESECLDALTDFFDLMSYLDATLPPAGTRVSDSFVWTGAEVKDGLLDEMREEEDSSYSKDRLLDIQAAAEGLGCHRCLCRASEAWTEVQKLREVLEDKRWGRLMERLALTSSKRHSLSFSFQPLCEPSLSQRRYRLNRTVLSSKPFELLGNRRAVCVDYMPVLRSICRSHKAQKQEPLKCMNYLNNIHLGLSKSSMQLLAEGFT